MSDTDTKIISLLERLSVKAPERCTREKKPHTPGQMVVFYEGSWWGVIHDNQIYPHCFSDILYAVLEEAHSRGWEWRTTQSRDGWRLINSEWDTLANVPSNKGGILEEEFLPRLECLVLALESQP